MDRDLGLELLVLDVLHDLAALLGRDALVDRDYLAGRAAGGGLDVAAVQSLQRQLALHELLFENLQDVFDLLIRVRFERDRGLAFGLAELDARPGVLEVEARPDLARGLVDRVADLLDVYLGDDIERRVFSHGRGGYRYRMSVLSKGARSPILSLLR